MSQFNEYGEIIRENDPNDKSKISITFFEGLLVFIYNYLLFIPGLILYNNHKKKGYTRKAKQLKVIMLVQVSLLALFILLRIISY